MNTPPSGLPDDDITRALAKDRLGAPAVVFFVMSAAAPLTVVAGVVTTGYAVTGLTGIPVAFLVIGLVLSLFSVGYVAMGRYLPHAGAFYAYVSHGLGKVPGVATAWIALLTYNALQVALYGATGAAAQPLLTRYAGVDLPWWVFALVTWALVTSLGLLRVDVNGTVLAVLLLAEIALIGLYDIAFLAEPTSGYAVSTLSPTGLMNSGAGALLALALLGFTGFESSVVFSEESKNPRRTVPLATFTSIGIIAVLYGVSAWALAVATGGDKVVEASQESLQSGSILIFDLAATKLGPTFADLGGILFVTSLIAAMISFHNTTARYVFALGRERVLPPVFGDTSTNGSPWAGSVAQSVVGLVVIVTYAAFGLDPLVQLFYTLGTSGGFGALVLITISAYAIFAYFRRHPHNESIWRTTVAPGLAIVATTTVLVLAVANFATMLGVPETSRLRWGLPGLFVIVGIFGALYGLVLKVSRPAVYAAIGMGGKSTSSGVLTSPGAAFAIAPKRAGSVAEAWEVQP
jgi:amino acid transporter